MADDSEWRNRFTPRKERFEVDPSRFARGGKREDPQPVRNEPGREESAKRSPGSSTSLEDKKPRAAIEITSAPPRGKKDRKGSEVLDQLQAKVTLSPALEQLLDKAGRRGGAKPHDAAVALLRVLSRTSLSEEDARPVARLIHFTVFLNLLVPLLGVLICYAVRNVMRQKSKLIEHHARESLNFQFTILLYFLLSTPFPDALKVLIGVFALISSLAMAKKAKAGEWAKYPLTIRLLK